MSPSGTGKAVYTLKDVYDTNFVLKMFEELSIFDSEPNDEIEMCNGTVTNTKTGEEGSNPAMTLVKDPALPVNEAFCVTGANIMFCNRSASGAALPKRTTFNL